MMPRWFQMLFVTVMLCVAAVLAFCVVSSHSLRLQIEDVSSSLDFSRQREYKQQYEYDQAAAAIPEVRAQIDQTAPLAAAAKETETALRARRKQLRNENAALADELTQAQTRLAETRTLADTLAQTLGAACADLLATLPDPEQP